MHDLKTKTLVDERFEIIEKLGVGGMGIVYKAEQVGLNRIVALKVMLPHLLSDENSLARFELEAQALATLTHRNISLFYAYGIWHGRAPYIAMEFLDTGDLADLLVSEGGRLTWRRTLKIVRQICEGVGQAHKAGIIHRDLKPSNIFILHEGEEDIVKVCDFGLAKIVSEVGESRQKLTATGMLVGSPLYMSPEQVVGAPTNSTGDIYSVGCIMYQCLFGRPPHDAANTLEVFAQQLNSDCSLPKAEDLKNAPPELLTVLKTALAKEPSARYATMSEMAQTLAEIETKAINTPDAKIYFTPRTTPANEAAISLARVTGSILLILLAAAALMVTFNRPLLSAVASRLAKSHDRHSMETALKIGGFFEHLGAYNQSAPFYDAALSIADDPYTISKIAVDQAAMFKRAGQTGNQQTALTRAAKHVRSAYRSSLFKAQPRDVQRKFVVSSLIGLKDWQPPQSDHARVFEGAGQDIMDLELLEESKLARAIWLVWFKRLEHHASVIHSGALELAVEMLECGPSLPYRVQDSETLEKAMGYKFEQSPAAIRQLANEVVAAAAAGRNSDALGALLKIAFAYCLYDQSEQAALQYMRALYAFQRVSDTRSDFNTSFHFFRSLSDIIPTLSESAQIEFYNSALANENRRAMWDESRYDIRVLWDSRLAQIYLDRHQPDKAIAIYKSSIHTAQHQPFVSHPEQLERFVFTCELAIGRILMDQKKWKEALPYFQNIEGKGEKHVWAYPHHFASYGTANCIAHIAGPEAALTALKATKPRDQAEVLIKAGRNDLALKVLEKCLQTAPKDERLDILPRIGQVCALMNDKQKCLANFKESLTETEASPDVPNKVIEVASRRMNLGRALIRFGDRDAGERQFMQALDEARAAPDAVDQRILVRTLYYELGNFYLAESDTQKAQEYFSRCRDMFHASDGFAGNYHCTLAGLAYARHDLKTAQREVRRALEEFYASSALPECNSLSWSARVNFALGKSSRAATEAAIAISNWNVCNRQTPVTALDSEYLALRSLCREMGVETD